MCTTNSRPGSSLFIPGNRVQPFLDPQSIRNIPSLGEVTYKLLRRIRIKVIRTLRQVPSEAMNELLGKPGIQLWNKANGVDPNPVIPYSEKKSIAAEHSFDQDTQNLYKLKAILISLVEKVAFQLRDSNLMCSIVSVRIRYTNGDTETLQKRVAFTSGDETLIQYALELFQRLYQRRMLLRLIGIKLSGMVQGNYQIDLFSDNLKMIRLYQAMDHLKHRFKNPVLVRRANGITS
jgi:DNA polymerase-4